MKVLISFYSRTGVTRTVAGDMRDILIGKGMECEIEDLLDKKNRDGKMGYLIAGKDALTEKRTEIGDVKHEPKDYDLVILGTPVWAGKMTPALRTYTETRKGQFQRTAFFCTHGGGGESKTFDNIKDTCGRTPESTLSLKDKDVAEKKHLTELKKFVDSL